MIFGKYLIDVNRCELSFFFFFFKQFLGSRLAKSLAFSAWFLFCFSL